jgi:splicing factor 3A subunit 3
VQVITRTKENAEKKLTLTYEEMEAEREEVLSFPLMQLILHSVFFNKELSFCLLYFLQEEVQADSESDDEDQQIYNPLKLPMGWDGKPIPYWLYKLHGLGQVTTCESCVYDVTVFVFA